MSALLESLLLLASMAASYVWVSSPDLRPYSLQLTAVLFGVFFLSKRLSRSAGHHVLPNPRSLETSFLLAAVALVVGSSGGVSSPFLPLFHLLLFFSALSLRVTSNLVAVLALTVFLWGVSPHPFAKEDWIELLSLPFLLPLLLFARLQLDEVQAEKYRLENQIERTTREEVQVTRFLGSHLRPKLRHLREQLQLSPHNAPVAAKQLLILEDEAQRIEQELNMENTQEY